jgi:hypothetical protein
VLEQRVLLEPRECVAHHQVPQFAHDCVEYLRVAIGLQGFGAL